MGGEIKGPDFWIVAQDSRGFTPSVYAIICVSNSSPKDCKLPRFNFSPNTNHLFKKKKKSLFYQIIEKLEFFGDFVAHNVILIQ